MYLIIEKLSDCMLHDSYHINHLLLLKDFKLSICVSCLTTQLTLCVLVSVFGKQISICALHSLLKRSEIGENDL